MHPGIVRFFCAGAGNDPCFQTRSGAPAEAELKQALDILSARREQLGESKKQVPEADETPATLPVASRELVEWTPLVQSDPEVS